MLPPLARDRESRARAIPPHLDGFDVVVLSELFEDVSREAILGPMRRDGWQMTPVLGGGEPERCDVSLGPVQLRTGMGLNGGVVILSKHRLVASEERIFRHYRGEDDERQGPACVGEDCCSAKGVLYARFETAHQNAPPCLHVFGTHLQNQSPLVGAIRRANADAPRRARTRQLRMIRAFIEDVVDLESCPGPVLVAGDLNLQPNELDEALRILNAVRPTFHGPPSWGAHNRYASADVPEHLDYALVTRDWGHPLYAINETRILRAPHDYSRRRIGFSRANILADLSDHHAVAGRYEWGTPAATGSLHWEIGSASCADGQAIAVPGTENFRGALCSHGEVERAGWCHEGLAECARGRRCTQVVNPEAEEPEAYDEYVCWGPPEQ